MNGIRESGGVYFAPEANADAHRIELLTDEDLEGLLEEVDELVAATVAGTTTANERYARAVEVQAKVRRASRMSHTSEQAVWLERASESIFVDVFGITRRR